MARYIDADVLYGKLYPLDLVDKKLYTINAKAVADAIAKTPTADVAPKSEEGAECPICHGTGRIGTTDWLTKNMSKKQLAEEKTKAIAEHEQHIKSEVAREIFEEILNIIRAYEFDALTAKNDYGVFQVRNLGTDILKLKKKYTEEKE